MKKLILLLLTFSLSSESFANLERVPLENQKKYFLAVTTGDEGESTIGKWPYGRPSDSTPTFYISTKQCKTEKCFNSRDEVYNSALVFAKNYNDLMKQNGLDGKYHISVSDKESMWGGIPILLTDQLSSHGRMDCSKGSISGNLAGCKIKILTASRVNIPNVVSHEMINFLGIFDTGQDYFYGCLSSDYTYRIETPQSLCEIEQKAIVFAYKHLRPGVRKGSVEKAFDRHWQGFKFNSVASAN